MTLGTMTNDSSGPSDRAFSISASRLITLRDGGGPNDAAEKRLTMSESNACSQAPSETMVNGLLAAVSTAQRVRAVLVDAGLWTEGLENWYQVNGVLVAAAVAEVPQ